MFGHAAPLSPVDTIASAPANGGATVTAVHLPGRRTIYVACSNPEHRVLNVSTYTADTSSAEIRIARAAANWRTFAHATECGARR